MQVETVNAVGGEPVGAKKSPKVSVCVMTYNQQKYIAECLQSILDQETDFEFEVIVADDCSTDGTQEIIKEFVGKYPHRIIPVLHPKNVGVGLNYRSAHDRAVGEYVAHCDGDDIWLPGKLAYQADLLDENPHVSQCWGCAYLIDDDGKKIGIFPSRAARLFYPHVITARDIALSYALVGQHSTQMYRRKFKFDFDTSKPVLDFWIAFNMATKGPTIYSKKIISGYRMTRMPSITRLQNKNRPTVDILANHLIDIIQTNSLYAEYAKANLITRKIFSKLKNHSLSELNKQLAHASSTPTNKLLVCKSAFFFILQKIF